MGRSEGSSTVWEVAYRLKLSARALREVGEARQWYEEQSIGLGEEFLAAAEAQLEKVKESPLLYPEPIPRVRCSHMSRSFRTAFSTRFEAN